MKILLIGNGFDLEHGLPTSYKDFLDFCERAGRIYSYSPDKTTQIYERDNLSNWNMNDEIKEKLLIAFNKRKVELVPLEKGGIRTEVISNNQILNEFYNHIHNNVWVEFFKRRKHAIGVSWIDFESEISRVIQALDLVRIRIKGGDTKNWNDEKKILREIMICTKNPLKDAIQSVSEIDDFIDYLNIELDRLIRALEIYIAEFVGGITVSKRSKDIEEINPDYILTFNYSDTYERVYDKGKRRVYDYIHGKADIHKNIKTSNLVLGIDEYLDDERKDTELVFLTFKKFYQRIYKSTGNHYLDLVDEIKDGYTDYLHEKNSGLGKTDFSEHTLYIFGHSLDVTDRDVLKLFICNDNVQTKIYYYREDEEDKKVLGKLIRNLIQIMGQDELIRRTGGAHKTIEFLPQNITEKP